MTYVAPLCPARHLPLKEGDHSVVCVRSQPPTRQGKTRAECRPISPHEGEICGRTEGGAKELRLRLIGLLLTAFFLAFGHSPASAAKVDALFQTWLENDLWPDARSRGISRATFDTAFAGVTPNLELPDLVMLSLIHI